MKDFHFLSKDTVNFLSIHSSAAGMTAPAGVEGLHLNPTLFNSVFGESKGEPTRLPVFQRIFILGGRLRVEEVRAGGSERAVMLNRAAQFHRSILQNRHASAHLTFPGKMSRI